jgi:hypothetical protein
MELHCGDERLADPRTESGSMEGSEATRMSEVYTSETRYEKGFDENIESDGVKYRTVCRKYSRWVVNGRIIEPVDPAEPKPQPIFMDRPRRSILVTI